MAVAGLVLAAGAGTRYGRPKILVPGWLDAALAALAGGGCTRLQVVTGAARVLLPAGVGEVRCEQWARGMGASLRAGLEALGDGPGWVVVHVVDCPDIGAGVVERVLARAVDRPARAVYGGRPGHPVVLPRSHVAPLLADLDDTSGAGRYLAARPDLVRVECGDLATGLDIDVPDARAVMAAEEAADRENGSCVTS